MAIINLTISFNVYQFHFKDFEDFWKKIALLKKTLLNNKLFMQSEF